MLKLRPRLLVAGAVLVLLPLSGQGAALNGAFADVSALARAGVNTVAGEALALVGVESTSIAVVEKRAIGESARGRTIWAYRKGRPGAAVTVVVGQVHGDERAGLAVARRLIEAEPVGSGHDLWVIPTINPDGAAARTRANARGIDLNRNFPSAVPTRGARSSWARFTASEPETKDVMTFLREVKPRSVVVLDSGSGGVGSSGAEGRALVQRLARRLSLPTRARSCTDACRGTLSGWIRTSTQGSAVAVDLGRSPSARALRSTGAAILAATRIR